MRRKAGRFFMILGALTVLSSLLLLEYNRNEAARAAKNAESALERVEEAIEEIETRSTTETAPDPVRPEQIPLISVEIDGYGYIGYLSVPALGLELPIMDSWDYTRLRIAPCRQFGETAENLIIAGHNYKRHFGSLKNLKEGDRVRFTDMAGNVTDYEIGAMETIGPNDADKIQSKEWNLVMYTCDYRGKKRVMAGCKILRNTAGIVNFNIDGPKIK